MVNNLLCELKKHRQDYDSPSIMCLIDSMAGALDETQQQTLLSKLSDDDTLYVWESHIKALYDLIKNKNKYKKKLLDNAYKRNEPVNVLIEWYNDKTSKKVTMARKKLRERFLHLTYDEQVLIMRLFLKGTKTDREWCYNTLRKWWSDELQDDVMMVWKIFHEERCGWLFPKYFPTEAIKQEIQSLTYDSNYYQLCKRLAEQEWFTIDKEKLLRLTSQSNYLWIMSRTRSAITKEEAFSVIYDWIAKSIAFYKKDIKKNDSHFEYTSIVPYSSWCIDYNFWMHNFKEMDKMLASLCKMGMWREVKVFLALDKALHDKFTHSHDETITFINYSNLSPDEDLLSNLCAEYIKFCELNFPPEYSTSLSYWKNISGKEIEEYSDNAVIGQAFLNQDSNVPY